MKDLILAGIAALIWSMSHINRQKLFTKKYEPYEMFLFRSPTFPILALITTMYLNRDLKVYQELTKKNWLLM